MRGLYGFLKAHFPKIEYPWAAEGRYLRRERISITAKVTISKLSLIIELESSLPSPLTSIIPKRPIFSK
jgi:hypothetical protein